MMLVLGNLHLTSNCLSNLCSLMLDNSNTLIVKVRGQISVYRGGSIIFGLSDYPISEFELVAEELLMSDSIVKVICCD